MTEIVTGLLINKGEQYYTLVNSGGQYLTVSGAWKGTIAPLESILNIWLNEYDRDQIKFDCKLVLQSEQYDSLEWKF